MDEHSRVHGNLPPWLRYTKSQFLKEDMKIITQGEIPQLKPIRATCSNCRTVFEFMPVEAKYRSDQRDGDYYEVSCPLCSKTVNVDVTKGGYPYG